MVNTNPAKILPVSGLEWTLIWASLRYFVGRQTISAAMYPAEIIGGYYWRLSEEQKKSIAVDIYDHFKSFGQISKQQIDHKIWLKFAAALDKSKHSAVKLTDGTTRVVFKVEVLDRLYPLDEYLKNPHTEIYIPKQYVEEYL